MTKQAEFDFSAFDKETGDAYARAGAQQAIDHAEAVVADDWQSRAFIFLCQYMKTVGSFLIEDCRRASIDQVPEPPSLRAWGGVVRKAAHAGLIRRIGYDQVKNVRAHSANASVWSWNRS